MHLQPHRQTHTSNKRRLINTFLGLATASTMLFTASSAFAGNCDSGCDSCSSGGSVASPGGAVFKTLDAFAGSIEKVLGLDKCKSSGCDSGACDSGGCDGCDAVMMGELMMPSAPAYVPEVHTQPRMIPRATPSPAPRAIPAPVAPSPAYEPMPRSVPAPRMAPRTAPRVVAPRTVPAPVPQAEPIIDSDAGGMSAPAIVAPAEPYEELPSKTEREQYEDYNAMPDETETSSTNETPIEAIPELTPDPPAEVPDISPPDAPPATPPTIKKEGGSLFDALDDPFKDDSEATLPQPYRTIRPSNYRSTKQPNGMLLNSPQARSMRKNTTHQHLYSNSRAGSLPYRTSTTSRSQASQTVNAQRRYIAAQKLAQQRSRSSAQRIQNTAPRTTAQTAKLQYSPQHTRPRTNSYRPATARQVSHDVQRGATSSAARRYGTQRASQSQAAARQRQSSGNSSQLHRYHHVQPQLKPAPRSSRGQRHSTANY